MTIKVGDRFPSVTLKYLGKEGMARQICQQPHDAMIRRG